MRQKISGGILSGDFSVKNTWEIHGDLYFVTPKGGLLPGHQCRFRTEILGKQGENHEN